MRTGLLQRFWLVGLACLLGFCLAAPGWADDSPKESAPKQQDPPKQAEPEDESPDDMSEDMESDDDDGVGSSARRWLQRMVRMRPPSIHERSHSKVKAAFRDSVVEATKSTVKVYANGKPVALGAIVDAQGLVITKGSELEGKLECLLADGRKLSADYIGLQREFDLAMLRIEASELTPVVWAEDEPPRPGSWLITTGLRQDPAAVGVVSVLPRQIAAPRGVLGILLEQADKGPRVTEVLPDSGAAEAKVKVDDVITHINGVEVKATTELIETVREYQPGDRIRLQILRDGKRVSLTATLGDIAVTGQGRRERFQNSLGGPELSKRRAGFPSALQHDTVLHPYQCGGPVVNLDGQTVGINIAHSGRVSSYALPTAAIRPLLEELKSGKLRPGPSKAEIALELATRLEELQKTVEGWTQKVADLKESLDKSVIEVQNAAKIAESDDADEEAKKVLNDAREAQKKLESAAAKAKAALQEALQKLKAVKSEQVSLKAD